MRYRLPTTNLKETHVTSTNSGRRAPLEAVVGTAINHQVAFCGPLGVGKTTAVLAASSGEVASTEAQWSVTSTIVGRGMPKRTTTVGIDYGEWKADDGATYAIYGTPGQERFAEARSGALSPGAKIVLWLFGNSPNAFDETAEWLDLLEASDNHGRMTVAITRTEEKGARPLTEFESFIHERYPDIAVVVADPRSSDDVRRVVRVATGGSR